MQTPEDVMDHETQKACALFRVRWRGWGAVHRLTVKGPAPEQGHIGRKTGREGREAILKYAASGTQYTVALSAPNSSKFLLSSGMVDGTQFT